MITVIVKAITQPGIKMNKTAYALEGHFDPEHGPLCPYCQLPSQLIDSSIIYSTSYGKIWICPNFKECNAYVGTHKEGVFKDYPLGSLANKELREMRSKAHSVFDIIWKKEYMKRAKAYRWLQEQMNLDIMDCHIGEMNLEQANTVYVLCIEYLQTAYAAND